MNLPKKNLFVIAALLASSSAVDVDDLSDDDRLGIRAEFADEARQTDDGQLLTTQDYRVEIERVSIQSEAVDIRVRDDETLGRLLDELSYPTVEVAPFDQDESAELVLNHVQFQGRVFDDHGRLPSEGLGIAGQMPINVVVKRGAESGRLDVRFQLPTHYFDGIDYAMG